jgi:hypothetical protein
MPFVSRPSQAPPFAGVTGAAAIIAPSLIAGFSPTSASLIRGEAGTNEILNIIPGTFCNVDTLRDPYATTFYNNLSGTNAFVPVDFGAIGIASSNLSNLFPYPNSITLQSNSFLVNNSAEFRERTTGVTVFLTGSLGFSTAPTDIVSIFGVRGSSLANSKNAAFLSIDADNYLRATNSIDNAGASTFLVNDFNIPKIVTAVFNKTTSTLRISGVDYGTQPCENVFGGNDNNYMIQVGSPDNYYNVDFRTFYNVDGPTGIGLYPFNQGFNGIFDVLIYNSVLSPAEITDIENVLSAKWGIAIPAKDMRTYSNVLQIPRLCLWLDPTNSSNIAFSDAENTLIDRIYSSDNLSNTFSVDIGNAAAPIYNSTTKRINFVGYGISPLFPLGSVPISAGPEGAVYNSILPFFTGAGEINGITIFMLVTNNPLTASTPNYDTAVILAAFAPNDANELGGSILYPTISQNKSGDIFIGSNIIDTIYQPISFNTGVNNSFTSPYLNEPYLLTTRFTESNVRMSINGYSLQPIQASGLVTNDIRSYLSGLSGGKLGCYIGGSPSVGTVNYYNSSTEIGEVLIYKKILNTSETDIVNNHIFANYNITPTINQTDLIGWWDANDLAGGALTGAWAGKFSGPNLSNITTDTLPFVRTFTNPITNCNYNLVDLNNGRPSVLINISSVDISGDNMTIFMITTGSYNSNGTALQLGITDAPQVDITSTYYTPNKGMQMNLGNSYTRFQSGGALYISTYSIVNSNTANIFSIPNESVNKTPDTVLYEGNYLYNIAVGGNYDVTNQISSQPFKNSIGELIIYNRALNSGEYTNILGYLQSKWGIPLRTTGPPNNISDLLFWYDANDLSATSGTWVSKSGGAYGPDLIHNVPQSSTNVTNYNSNQFFSMDSASNIFSADTGGYFHILSSSYTFFVVTANINNVTVGIISGIVAINPVDPIPDDSYPGLAITIDEVDIDTFDTRICIANGVTNPGASVTRCFSLIEKNITPISFKNGIQITCINHKNISNAGYNKIRSKGTLFENSDSSFIEESGISPTQPVKITIGDLSTDGNYTYNGLIGEFIYYNRSLNDTETQSVFKYLESKWLNSGGPSNTSY